MQGSRDRQMGPYFEIRMQGTSTRTFQLRPKLSNLNLSNLISDFPISRFFQMPFSSTRIPLSAVNGSGRPNLKIRTDLAVHGSLHLNFKIRTDSAVHGSRHPYFKIRTDFTAHESLHPILKIWTDLAVHGSLRFN